MDTVIVTDIGGLLKQILTRSTQFYVSESQKENDEGALLVHGWIRNFFRGFGPLYEVNHCQMYTGTITIDL